MIASTGHELQSRVGRHLFPQESAQGHARNPVVSHAEVVPCYHVAGATSNLTLPESGREERTEAARVVYAIPRSGAQRVREILEKRRTPSTGGSRALPAVWLAASWVMS